MTTKGAFAVQQASARTKLRLVHSATTCRCASQPRGDLRPVHEIDEDIDLTAHLVRDLTWFSARAAEIGRPETPAEQRLLDRYQAMISHRRAQLLELRRTVA